MGSGNATGSHRRLGPRQPHGLSWKQLLLLRATQSPLIAVNPGPKRKAMERLFGDWHKVLRQPRAHLPSLSPAWGGARPRLLCPHARALPALCTSAWAAEVAQCWDTQLPAGILGARGPEGPLTPAFATKTAAPHVREIIPQGATTPGAGRKLPQDQVGGPAGCWGRAQP